MNWKRLLPHTRYQYGGCLFVLLACAYAVDYGSRGAFSTSITAITAETGWTKSSLGMAGTGFYFMYAVAQLIMGPIADRTDPKKMIALGLCLSGVFTFFTGLAQNVVLMVVLWSINGLAQSIIWPPLIRMISEWMPRDQRAKGALWISAANPLGAVLLYVTSAVVFLLTNWRGLFFVFSAILFLMAAFTYRQLSNLKKKLDLTAAEDGPEPVLQGEDGKPAPAVSMKTLFFSSGMLLICFSGVLLGFLREGIVAWAPTFLVEQYSLPNVQAVLLTSVLPMVNLSGAVVTAMMLKRNHQNEALTNCILFLIAAAAIVCLRLFSGTSALIGVLFLAITTASQLGTGSVVTMIPIYFAPFHKSGTMMGILNFFICTGISAASYSFGAIAERFGWNVTMVCWIVVALVGAVISLVLMPRWNRFKSKLREQAE